MMPGRAVMPGTILCEGGLRHKGASTPRGRSDAGRSPPHVAPRNSHLHFHLGEMGSLAVRPYPYRCATLSSTFCRQ